MDKIEEVKRTLENNTMSWYRDDKETWIDITAKKICQLFELKSDESRLLTDTEKESAYGGELPCYEAAQRICKAPAIP